MFRASEDHTWSICSLSGVVVLPTIAWDWKNIKERDPGARIVGRKPGRRVFALQDCLSIVSQEPRKDNVFQDHMAGPFSPHCKVASCHPT